MIKSIHIHVLFLQTTTKVHSGWQGLTVSTAPFLQKRAYVRVEVAIIIVVCSITSSCIACITRGPWLPQMQGFF